MTIFKLHIITFKKKNTIREIYSLKDFTQKNAGISNLTSH